MTDKRSQCSGKCNTDYYTVLLYYRFILQMRQCNVYPQNFQDNCQKRQGHGEYVDDVPGVAKKLPCALLLVGCNQADEVVEDRDKEYDLTDKDNVVEEGAYREQSDDIAPVLGDDAAADKLGTDGLYAEEIHL